MVRRNVRLAIILICLMMSIMAHADGFTLKGKVVDEGGTVVGTLDFADGVGDERAEGGGGIGAAGSADDESVGNAGVFRGKPSGDEGAHGVPPDNQLFTGISAFCKLRDGLDVVHQHLVAVFLAEIAEIVVGFDGTAVAGVLMHIDGKALVAEIFRYVKIAVGMLRHAVHDLDDADDRGFI